MRRSMLRVAAVVPLLVLNAQLASAQQRITTPEQQFGHPIGADYVLPNYTQFVAYWQKLAAESDRMVLDTIGLTEEGRPQLMAIITSPENHRNLQRYQQIARQLALAEVPEAQARQLAAEGKAIVWIDGGLHATEVLGAQQLMETVYQLVSRTDEETTRILRDVVILAVHANPDGMELVSNWYMRNPNPQQRSTGGIPRLYQKYVGHDNNRDFYGSTQSESENMNRVMYTEWFPQIMYNHHQTGPLIGHIIMMMAAVTIAHIGSARAKKQTVPAAASRMRAITIGVTLLVIVAGILSIGRPIFGSGAAS